MSGGPTAEVYRIDWIPGTDELLGLCHCGATHRGQDPALMWEWMLAHPVGHTPATQVGDDGKEPVGGMDDEEGPRS